MPAFRPRPRPAPRRRRIVASLLAAAMVAAVIGAPVGAVPSVPLVDEEDAHLLVSEVLTGGTGASDEFIELYNPGPVALPLEGLEVIYVSASGATLSRRAAWALGAPEVPPRAHVLLANEAGIYSGIADVTYAGGMAATGGSVAIRILGASSAIDAVGWGTTTSTWREGSAAPAAPAGSSLERRPGGAAGSTIDTDDNLADFLVRDVPEPRNSTSAPVPDPSATPSPAPTGQPSAAPSPSPAPTAAATPAATATPAPSVMSIADARSSPDGARVRIAGVALTDSTFSEGGGYIADATGGIAVLLSSGAFLRGDSLVVSGTVDDRFHQRTIRAVASDLTLTGTGTEPMPAGVPTGGVGESVEARLVAIVGEVVSGATSLSGGTAYDVDDGSGPVRVFVGSATGVTTAEWVRGTRLQLVGVVGQRDSTGTGAAGYRVQPRDASDVTIQPPAPGTSPTPAASASASPGATPTPAPGEALLPVAEARSAAANARVRVRGVVTSAKGLVDPVSVTIQDETGAIVLRLTGESGAPRRGARIEVSGIRSTLAGMLTIRVTAPHVHLGDPGEPAAPSRSTGALGEGDEARLVTLSGAVTLGPRRTSGGGAYLDLDDGSGPARVILSAASGIDPAGIAAGSWLEVRGIVGQQTSTSRPDEGYRLLPRDTADIRVVAGATGSSGSAAGAGAGGQGGSSAGAGSAGGGSGSGTVGLEALMPGAPAGAADLAGGVAATLVSGPWTELNLAGLVWDGKLLAAFPADPTISRQVAMLLARGAPPVAVRIRAVAGGGLRGPLDLPLLELQTGDGLARASGGLAAPLGHLPDAEGSPAWVRLQGTLAESGTVLETPDGSVVIDRRCDRPEPLETGALLVMEGIGVGVPEPRLVVGCHGISAPPVLAAGQLPQASPHGMAPPIAADAGPAEGPPVLVALILAVSAACMLLVVAWRTGALERLREALLPAIAGDDQAAPGPDDVQQTGADEAAARLVLVPRDRGSP